MAIAKGEASMMFVCRVDAEGHEIVLRFGWESVAVESRKAGKGELARETRQSWISNLPRRRCWWQSGSLWVRQRAATIWLEVGAMRHSWSSATQGPINRRRWPRAAVGGSRCAQGQAKVSGERGRGEAVSQVVTETMGESERG